MNPIRRADTIQLLKRFWELTNKQQFDNLSEEERTEKITEFIKVEFPNIKNPLNDIWDTVLFRY